MLSQISGSGRGELGSYNSEQYRDLTRLLEEQPMKDGDAWLSLMMRRNKMLGMVDNLHRTGFCERTQQLDIIS